MAYIPSSGSVVAFQGTNPWIVTGSVQASLTPAANQSVSGTIGASIIGLTPVAVTNIPSISGTVLVGNFPTTQNVSGSVVATQGTNPWVITGSVQASLTPAANQSVSGTVGASIIGTVPVTQSGTMISSISGTPSISGTVLVGNTSLNVGGSVVAFQGSNPWIITGSVQGSFSPSGNQSVSGTVGASIIGTAPVTQGGTWIASVFGNVSVLGTVPVTQATTPWVIAGSIAGTYTEPVVVTSVTGIAVMFKTNVSTSTMGVVSTTNPLPVNLVTSINQSVSGTIGASIIGLPPVNVTNTNLNIGGSVVAFQAGTNITSVSGQVTVVSSIAGGIFPISGSVAATIVGVPNVNTTGSVAVLQLGTWKTSIASEYPSNSASIISALGNLTLGVRNDTLGSVLAATDGSYGPFTVGSWGDQIVSLAPSSKWVSGAASLVAGVQLPVITSVLGTRVNITGIQIANASPNNVYISFFGAGLGSVVGSVISYTVAAGNGGSNINFPIPLQTAINAGFSASVSGVASVFISAQGFLSKV